MPLRHRFTVSEPRAEPLGFEPVLRRCWAAPDDVLGLLGEPRTAVGLVHDTVTVTFWLANLKYVAWKLV